MVKRLVLSMLILAPWAPVLAQTVTATPGATAARHPSLRDRIKDLEEKIREEESAGKIDGQKGKDLLNKVKQARMEISDDIRTNGKKPLTDGQTQKIENELEAISPQL